MSNSITVNIANNLAIRKELKTLNRKYKRYFRQSKVAQKNYDATDDSKYYFELDKLTEQSSAASARMEELENLYIHKL